MTTPLQSLINTGTKLWLDSVDPEAVEANRALGATGATSNPVIISDLIKTGRFDDDLAKLMSQGLSDDEVAWQITDELVSRAEAVFAPVFESTKGDDGYVSFELDPLIDDLDATTRDEERSAKYIELGKSWAAGHPNRMIKVPVTPAGIGSLEELVASGVTVNVTLIFNNRQYREARDAVWRGAQRRDSLDQFKSVYSIFISRIDVYTEQQVSGLSDDAQGEVGIVNAKRIWQENEKFWADKRTPLAQEMIFASTGTKKPEDPKDKYVAALAGSDIQTNPPGTNASIQEMDGRTFTRRVDEMPDASVLSDIDEKVDFEQMEEVLMREGLQKFSDPQRALLQLIQEKRSALVAADE
ncbi:MAG: transaldolase [Planctomycetaceae bacterium]|nr:transaldolase [Planctomycetaceae bacterium]